MAGLPLVRNASLSVLSLDDQRGPKGCLIDSQQRAYFNVAGSADSEYQGLMAVCSMQDEVADVYRLPPFEQETIIACGEEVTIPTYNISIENLMSAILALSEIERFALRIGKGTARISGSKLNQKTKVVLLGHSPDSADVGKTVLDLEGRYQILIDNSSACLQDLHITNGKVSL